ncbi:MAG: DUF4143 domain-containing protein [Trueperaceae bacterium]
MKALGIWYFADQHGVDVIDLDDLVVRDAVAASPSAINTTTTPICIDEIQYVPQVLDAIKARLNREGVRPRVAVLAGSTRQDAVPRTAQALTGRMHRFVILPLSQGEIQGAHENLLTGSPKVHVVDSGLAARLLRLGQDKLASLDPATLTEFGHLLETFVVGELQKQVSWLDESVTVGHWRTSDGDEVDFVVEFDDGRLLTFEVKAGERVSGKDLTGLRKLRDSLGARFIGGVVLSLRSRSYSYAEGLHVMPVDRLWQEVRR